MATLLLPASTNGTRPSTGTASLALLCSPIRGADGSWRVLRQEVTAGAVLTAVVPPTIQIDRIVVNGGVVAPERYATHSLQAGDEVLVIPQWGIPAAIVPFLIYAAVGIAVSIAATALSYVLFPPPKAHNIQHVPDEPSFSFEGIRTTHGPGAPVPVIYGRQRTGGQMLSSSVDQTITILDTTPASRRLRASSAPATLSLLLALGEGPVGLIDTSSIEINGQPIGNFPTAEVFTVPGTADQSPLPYFGETKNTFGDGRTLTDAVSGLVYTTSQPIQAFVLNIAFQRGLFAMTDRGEKVDNNVDIQYRWRVAGSGVPGWSGFSGYDVVANRTSVVRFGIRREGLALAMYDIELQLTNVNQTHNAEWEVQLESVTEIQSNVQAYPNTALLGLRAVATDTLQGAIPNVTVEVLGRQVRDSFLPTETYSDNPAWCTMDFMTNTRYGMGIPDSQIDLGAFVAWAAYCNEPIGDGEKRHVLNYTLDRDVRAQQALLEMAGGSRTVLFKSEGLWTPRPTRNDVPVQLLSWANCTDLKLTYTRDPERVNVIEARFANEDLDFEQDVLTWPTIANWPPHVRKTSLELRGVTKPSRVMRAMQFELNRRQFENLSLEMTCMLDAIVLQPHDLFRFSHPLPGWGVSGRIQPGSTQTLLYLDQEVVFSGSQSYIVYVRHDDGTTEVKSVSYPGDVPQRTLTLNTPLSAVPAPRTSLWAFGVQQGPVDTAVKIFRVIRMQRMSDTTVRLQAMIHNPSIYDEAVAVPLPVITDLFNPLGPPPALTSLVLTEVTRIAASGASMRVVNLSWDVGSLGTGLAPYGGALIQRRTVMSSAAGGQGALGGGNLGELQSATDGGYNFQPLTQVTGHVLDYDDYTILTGTTYVYRVIPVSARGVPNIPGAREATIHVAGPTTPAYFPGTPQNLRLKGLSPTDHLFEGPDAQFEWDPVDGNLLFTTTFFVTEYIVEIWAPAQVYLMRRIIVASRSFSYTLQYNAEDQIRAGQPGARRDFMILVYARTNTGLTSQTPASLSVNNPPPDMGDMVPVIEASFASQALISFDQFREPQDFDHYQVFLDTVNPPQAIYEELSIAIHRPGFSARKLNPVGLIVGATYYVYIWPYDTFGPGIPTGIVAFVAGGITAEQIDTTPPATPTGLVLTTGTSLSPDGTVHTWVQANWAHNVEPDLAGYQVDFFFGTSPTATTYRVDASKTSVRHESAPGNTLVTVRMNAFDQFQNPSPFTASATLTTGADAAPPAAPSNLQAFHSHRGIRLLWTPPADVDYHHADVYANGVENFFGSSSRVGEGFFSFFHEAIDPQRIYYYWLRAVDTSGNVSVGTFPASFTNGVSAAADQIDSTYIQSLIADKISTGILTAFYQLGVGANLSLDGPNRLIYVTDDLGVTRGEFGKIGNGTQTYGLRLRDENGFIMWDFLTGAQTEGINDGAVNAAKIRAGSVQAHHLVTDTAVITVAAQIAFATITNAHILNNLTADKLISSPMIAVLRVGHGGELTEQLFLDGINSNIHFYDASVSVGFPNGRLRGMLGKLGPGAQEYGLRLWNAAGDLMWDFNTGASTLGLQDLSVTNAKIFDLTATKITTGTLTAFLQVGVGPQLFLDGPNANLHVYDQNVSLPDFPGGHLRVMLGKLPPGGSTDYGLRIWNAAGDVMWDLTSGASTLGIQPHAVTESIAFTTLGNVVVSASETAIASITFPFLNPGDDVWIMGMSTAGGVTGDRMQLRLRLQTLSGPLLATAIVSGPIEVPVNIQYVYQATGGPTTFIYSIVSLAGGGGVTQSNLTCFRRQR